MKNPKTLRKSPGEEVSLQIEKIVAGGQGLARLEGKAVFIAGVLPGETVRARIIESKRDFERAELVSVEQSSPRRVIPVCPVAGICGGCDWIFIDYAEQLRLKVELATEAFLRVGGLKPPQFGIEPSSPLGYRNRIQVHLDADGRAGFMGRKSRRVVPLQECPVAVPGLQSLFLKKPEAAGMGRFPAFAYRDASGNDVLHSGEGGDGGEIVVSVLGKPIAFNLRCFFQSNLVDLEKLIPYVLSDFEGSASEEPWELALDLYGGIGMFGAFLSQHFKRILVVEENREALRYARLNIPGEAHTFRAARVESWVTGADSHLDVRVSQGKVAAFVDPPRTGLDAGVIPFLGRAPLNRLTYVSCNPVTLARDAGRLVAEGWEIAEGRLFDFYPQTSHIEAVVKFVRTRNA